MPKEEAINNNLKQYRPVEGPTHRQLTIGLWWVNNRDLLRRILIGCLIFVSCLSWGWTLYNFGYYIFQGILEDEQILADILAPQVNENVVQAQMAKDLEIGSVAVLNSANSTYDMAVKVRNPNKNWYVRFNYSFANEEPQAGFIMPQETKYLASFLNQGTGSRLQLTDLKWHRVNASEIKDVASFVRDHIDIDISDISIGALQFADRSSGLQQINFTAANNSAYNYWEVHLYLVAESGSRLLGINKYVLEKFKSGEEKGVSVLWSGSLPSRNIAIIPSIDIFDEDNYMPFELGPGQLK